MGAPEPAPAAPAPVPNLWDSILALGGGDPRQAVARADSVDQLGLALTHFHLDSRTEVFAREIRDRIVDLDFGKLWRLFPSTPKTEKRVLPIVGRNVSNDDYRLTCFPTGKGPAGRPLGRLDAHVALEPTQLPVTGRDGYRVDGDARIGMADLTYQQIAGSGEAALRLVEKAAHVSLWRALHEAFPSSTTFLERFVAFDASQTVLRTDQSGGSYLQVDLTLRLRVEAFKRPYKKIYDYLQGLGDLFRFSGGVWNGSGQALARFRTESQGKILRVRFLTRDGAILPMDNSGNPTGTAFRWSDIRKQDFLLSFQGEVHKYGTTFNLHEYPVTLSFAADRDRLRFSTEILKPPEVVVSENVLYVLPKDLADWFVPGQIDQDTRDFFQALATGPDGHGSGIQTEFVNGTGSAEGSWTGQAHAAVLDNLLVKLALRTIGKNLMPDDEASRDLEQLGNEFRRRLSADYHAARTKLLPQTGPGK